MQAAVDQVSFQVMDVKKLDPNCRERNEIQVSSEHPSNQTEPTSIIPQHPHEAARHTIKSSHDVRNITHTFRTRCPQQ